MSNTQRGTIHVGDGELYYEMAGSGTPLVLCHAGFVDSGMWDDQWEEYARFFHVVRYDMRGYGRSGEALGPMSRRTELESLIDQLAIQHAVLVGCSMGGATVLDLALEHPEKAEALVLVSTVPGGFEFQGPPPPDLIDMFAAMRQGDLGRVSELQLRLWVDGRFRQPEQTDPQVRRRAAEMNRIPVERGTWARVDAQPLAPLDPPAVLRLDQIHVPTLIVDGALDDPEVLRAAGTMERGIPGARKLVIPDAAHVPNMERPAEFNQAVLSFLRERLGMR
ncbi:MAG TPA: alpha/beta hydrolase [Anaerolineae bacterium]